MHRSSLLLIVAVLLMGGVARSQSADRLEFEVASVRAVSLADAGPRGSGVRRGGPGTSDPGQVTFSAVTLEDILAYAFDLSVRQVSGPDWIIRDRYTIRAKIPENTTEAGAREMLRNLLVERMGLVFHLKSQMTPGYELRIARDGLRLSEPNSDVAGVAPQVDAVVKTGADGFPELPPGVHSGRVAAKGHLRFRFSDAPLSDLALQLRPLLPAEFVSSSTDENGKFAFRPQPALVLDKTGLTGRYDFTFEFEGIGLIAPKQVPDVLVKIQSALQRKLGLTLVEAKLPEDVLVIDSLRKVPEEN